MPAADEHVGDADVLQCDHVLLAERPAFETQLQRAHAVAGMNGRDQRLHALHGRLEPVGRSFRNRHVIVLGEAGTQQFLRALPYRHLVHRLASGIKLERVESLETVVEQFLRLRRAPVLGTRIQDHRNQAPVATPGCRDHAEARALRVAGLHAVDERVAAEQPVAVVLRDVAIAELAQLVHREILRELADDCGGQQRQVFGGRIVLGIRQPRYIGEAGVLQAQAHGLAIHLIDEGRFAAGHALGEGNGSVVAGLHDHSLKQVFNRNRAARLQEHARTGRAPGFLRNRDCLRQGDPLLAQGVEGHVRGHQLGQ